MGPQREQYKYWLDRYGVPEHMHEAYLQYLMHGIQPGEFLTAVLSNDLKQAYVKADDQNRRALYKHVRFLYYAAPSHCWGSPEKVKAWMASFRKTVEVS